jgi:hypothetical protein
MKQNDSDVYYYLINDMDIKPISIAFKWILYAFVGILDAEQTLFLWDRIIAFDSLELLPLTAAAIVSFRKNMVLCSSTEEEVLVLIFSNLGMF